MVFLVGHFLRGGLYLKVAEIRGVGFLCLWTVGTVGNESDAWVGWLSREFIFLYRPHIWLRSLIWLNLSRLVALLLQLGQFNLGVRLTFEQFYSVIFKREITIPGTWKLVVFSRLWACKGLRSHITIRWQLSFLLKCRIDKMCFVQCRCLARNLIHLNLWKWLLLPNFERRLRIESGVFVEQAIAVIRVKCWGLWVDDILLEDTSTLLSMCLCAIENLLMLSCRFVLYLYLFWYS